MTNLQRTLVAALALCTHGLTLQGSIPPRQPLQIDAAGAGAGRAGGSGSGVVRIVKIIKNTDGPGAGTSSTRELSSGERLAAKVRLVDEQGAGKQQYDSLTDQPGVSSTPRNLIPAVDSLDGIKLPFVELQRLIPTSASRDMEIAVEAQHDNSAADAALTGSAVVEIPFRRVIFVTFSMFAGRSCMLVLQQKLKASMGIDEVGTLAREFTFAVSLNTMASLIFRLGHNFVFAPLSSAQRVLVAQVCMMISLSIAIALYYTNAAYPIPAVGIAYFLSGMAIGTFESNVISAITPLGQETKVYALAGLPLGFNGVAVIGFALMGQGIRPVCVYIAALVAVVIGMVTFHLTMPTGGHAQKNIYRSLFAYKQWAPQCLQWWVAIFVMGFVSSSVPPAFMYIYNGNLVPLNGPATTNPAVNHDYFFAFVNFAQCLGDTISRKIAYKIPGTDKNRVRWMIIAICIFLWMSGTALGLSTFGFLVPVGSFLLFFGTGLMYASGVRHIDKSVDKSYNIVALSCWLFVCDIAAVIGSNLIDVVREVVCDGEEYPYVCLEVNN